MTDPELLEAPYPSPKQSALPCLHLPVGPPGITATSGGNSALGPHGQGLGHRPLPRRHGHPIIGEFTEHHNRGPQGVEASTQEIEFYAPLRSALPIVPAPPATSKAVHAILEWQVPSHTVVPWPLRTRPQLDNEMPYESRSSRTSSRIDVGRQRTISPPPESFLESGPQEFTATWTRDRPLHACGGRCTAAWARQGGPELSRATWRPSGKAKPRRG